MIQNLKLTALILALTATAPAGAVILHSCESVESIQKRADDEICDYMVEAAEDCFAKLNARYSLLIARPANTPPKEIVIEAEPIKESYEAAISVVKSYKTAMKGGICGDQRERVDVMVDEMGLDLKDVSQRIAGANQRLRK